MCWLPDYEYFDNYLFVVMRSAYVSFKIYVIFYFLYLRFFISSSVQCKILQRNLSSILANSFEKAVTLVGYG